MNTALKKLSLIVPALAFAGFFLCAAAASAVDKSKPAEVFIQSLGDRAILSLTEKTIPRKEREQRLRSILTDNFDVATIGKFAMGRYWKDASEKQRAEYLKLFENMVVQAYTNRFEDYAGEVFEVDGSMSASDTDMIVHSHIKPKDGPVLNVDWRVRMFSGNYRVIDAIVEGISMSVTQRSDFASVIQQGGGTVDALITSLKKRTASTNG